MDAEARSQYPSISKDQWDQLGYLDAASLRTSNLSNEVHPILSFTWKGRDRWNFEHSGFTEEKTCSLMLPSLRLVSNLITSAPGVHFFHAIFLGPRRELVDLTAQLGGEITQHALYPTKDIDTNEARKEVESALKRLAEHSYLEFADLANDAGMAMNGGARAMVRAARSPKEINILDDDSRKGVSVRITINPKWLTALEEAHSQPNNTGCILSIQFNLAKTIYHELQHAADLATNKAVADRMKMRPEEIAALGGFHFPEPYFEGQQISELGYSAEQFTFGGRVDWDFGSIAGTTSMYEWPGLFEVEDFERGPGPKSTARRWIVSMRYIRRVQQQAFWITVDPDDVQALLIPKRAFVEYGIRRLAPSTE
ncbi:hypothetical protein P7C71_g2500, partial [Lecanoromycetidae sp. Uapishka_2]